MPPFEHRNAYEHIIQTRLLYDTTFNNRHYRIRLSPIIITRCLITVQLINISRECTDNSATLQHKAKSVRSPLIPRDRLTLQSRARASTLGRKDKRENVAIFSATLFVILFTEIRDNTKVFVRVTCAHGYYNLVQIRVTSRFIFHVK